MVANEVLPIEEQRHHDNIYSNGKLHFGNGLELIGVSNSSMSWSVFEMEAKLISGITITKFAIVLLNSIIEKILFNNATSKITLSYYICACASCIYILLLSVELYCITSY